MLKAFSLYSTQYKKMPGISHEKVKHKRLIFPKEAMYFTCELNVSEHISFYFCCEIFWIDILRVFAVR